MAKTPRKKTPRTTRRKKAPPKRPPATPPKQTSPPAADLAAIRDRLIVLVASLKSRAAVEIAARDKLGLSPDVAADLITEAYAAILDAALYRKQAAAGEAMIRLHDLYERSLTIQDVKTALAAQKELNRLQDLYTWRPPAAGDLATPPKPSSPPDEPAQPDTLQGLRLIG